MINTFSSKRIWGCIIICAVMCCFSFLALAQERKSDQPETKPAQAEETVKDTSTLTYTGLENKQKPGIDDNNATIKTNKIDQPGDPDRPLITGQVPNPELRAGGGYIKIGDIKGESDEGATASGNVTLKRGIVSEGGATHTDNWKENQAAQSTPVRELKAATSTSGYTCPDNKDEECTCSGVLDCNNLFISDKCKKDTQWQDGDDPSQGGCIQKSSSQNRPRTDGYVKMGTIKGEATDSKHKDWIVIESMSSPLRQQSTGDRMVTPRPQAYNCPPNDPECYCSGVLDCKKLWSSGLCKPNSEWEDSHDNSKGGCIEA